MMDEDDGGAEAALELAEEGKQGSDFTACVLIDAVEADKGIEDEEAWFQGGDGVDESEAVVLDVEPEGDGSDDVDVEAREIDVGGAADAFDATADDVQGVLSGEEEDGPLVSDGKTAQARGSRGNGDGHVQGKEGLAALGLASDDADGLRGPQVMDKPALLFWDRLEVDGTSKRQRRAHNHVRPWRVWRRR
jgi:hypothetical protein